MAKGKKEKVSCPICGKEVAKRGLGPHKRLAHSKEEIVQTGTADEKTPGEISPFGESEVDLENLLWMCRDCDATAPPTSADGMKLLEHQAGHHIILVDTTTGDVLATNVPEAITKGIIPKAEKKPESRGKAPDAPEGSKFTEQGITFTITQPAAYFTLFNAGKALGIIDPELDLDTWNWENAQKRFELDYKYKLMLVPIVEEGE